MKHYFLRILCSFFSLISFNVGRPSILCSSFSPEFYNLIIFPSFAIPLCASKTTTQVPLPILKYHSLMHVIKWISSSSNLRLSFTYAPWWHHQQKDTSKDKKTSKAWTYPMIVNGTEEQREQLINDPWQPVYFFTHKLLLFLRNVLHSNYWL